MPDTSKVDLTTICYTLPRPPEPQITRENFLYTIEHLFDSEATVVAVEGADGIGKTTLLTQFAKSHPSNTLSLFVSATNRWQSDADYLRLDLCNQLQFLLEHKELSGTEDIGDSFLRTRIFQLQKHARRTRIPFYWILDGLDEVPHDKHLRDILLGMLPIGLTGFRIIISGDPSHIVIPSLPRDAITSLRLTPFNLDETLTYLQDPILDRHLIEELYKSCRGVPSFLSSIKRILKQGKDPQVLLDELPDTLPELFSIEWESVQNDSYIQKQLLALLSLDKRQFTLEDLSRILGISVNEVDNLLSGLSFIISDTPTKGIAFVTTAFKRFAASRLQDLEQEITELCITDLQSQPESESALIYLPTYLEQAGRIDDLLSFLSPENFLRLLEVSQSLNVVREKADLGITSARQLQRDADLLRFTVQRSTIAQFDGAEIWRSEVEALIALNRSDAALALNRMVE